MASVVKYHWRHHLLLIDAACMAKDENGITKYLGQRVESVNKEQQLWYSAGTTKQLKTEYNTLISYYFPLSDAVHRILALHVNLETSLCEFLLNT